MTKISLIAAIARNGAIGHGGDMVYHLSGDLRHFKELTMGKPVIMGRKTFESLPKGALPGRRNIVITSNRDYTAPDIETVASVEEALDLVKDIPEAMIIGGGQIYAATLPVADSILLTIVEDTPAEADTFFPDIDPELWQMTESSDEETDPKTGLRYRFICLSRK